MPAGVREILGDQRDLAKSAPAFRDFSPDVVVNFILASERQAQSAIDADNFFSRRAGAACWPLWRLAERCWSSTPRMKE
jgi:hypothetical protein